MILIEVQEALDTDIETMELSLKKMKYFGFPTSLNKWFESYLSENFTFVLMFFLRLEL